VARIFLCHASEDKAQVREIYQRLRAIDGFEPWLDEEDILPGQEWAREIPRALQTSDFILIFLSRTSVAKRGYVQREMKQALDVWQELPEGTIHTIPVRLDDCDVPEQFRRYQYANLFDPNGFDRIVRAIRAELAKRSVPESPPILEPPLRAPESPVTPDTAFESMLTNSIGMEFVMIPAGTFMMGSPDSDPDAYENEKPAHQVTLRQDFYLGKYPVTQAQWEAVMGMNPSRFKGADRPVESVSWDDVQAFMQKLNAREGADHYRLPTEAQWEYACRAGSNTRYHFGDDAARLDEYAWYDENSGNQTHPVGQKQPNAWGLYDMHGNVWEWVQDWYGDDYYHHSPAHDPQGPEQGERRMLRGGGWNVNAGVLRSAHRNALHPVIRFDLFGFRLARGQISSR
jgi:formylglycine-generating enzyme required for sulfatase activity